MTFVPFNGFIVVEIPGDTDFAKSAGGLYMPGAMQYAKCRVVATSDVLLEDGMTRPSRVELGQQVYVFMTNNEDAKPGLPCPGDKPNLRLVREADIAGFEQ